MSKHNETRRLFREPTNTFDPGRVLLNMTEDPIRDLERIAQKYQELAHDRIEILKSMRRGVRESNHFEAYPIVFLYRQAFELTLKAIAFAGSVTLREEEAEPMPLKSLMRHELTPLFKEVCRIFKAFGARKNDPWDFEVEGLRTYDDFAAIVAEFDKFDSGSYTFRYSITTDGVSPTVERGFEFDLYLFAGIMDKIVPALSGVPGWIREQMDDRWEAAYEAQQAEWANAEFEAPEDEHRD